VTGRRRNDGANRARAALTDDTSANHARPTHPVDAGANRARTTARPDDTGANQARTAHPDDTSANHLHTAHPESTGANRARAAEDAEVDDGSSEVGAATGRVGRVAGLLSPLATPAAGELLADRIMAAIALGEFTPGQRLPAERELAARLGVSRTTVRDALARVVAAGLLEVRRGRSGGAFVRHPWTSESARAVRSTLGARWAELQSAFDMRLLVEALVARTAAERRDHDDQVEIRAALTQYEDATSLAVAQAADIRLHHAIARATKNPRLLAVREQLLSEVSFGFAVEPFTAEVYARALPQHQQLAEAVTAGDADAAWDVGRQHFSITEDELRAALVRAVAGAENDDSGS
jgi:GntR family transcriptional regulator, transcriptional repressor for pyruvate dehydrogenase complex